MNKNKKQISNINNSNQNKRQNINTNINDPNQNKNQNKNINNSNQNKSQNINTNINNSNQNKKLNIITPQLQKQNSKSKIRPSSSKKIPSNPITNSKNIPSHQKNIPKIPKTSEKNSKDSKDKKSTNIPNVDLNIFDQISNLTSLYNALSFINYKLDETFNYQKNDAEQTLNDKYNQAIKIKENNFNLYQQINSMSNIIDIDDYFMNNYSKIMSVFPKISNVAENMNDIVSNVNYGIDRLYLVDDLLCDENVLNKNIEKIRDDFKEMNNNLDKKSEERNENKRKYNELYTRLNNYEEDIKNIENYLDKFKHNVLTNNIDVIYQSISEKNKKLLNDILND